MFFGRGKNKIQDPYTMKDFYEFYIEGIESNNLYDISYNEYIEITKDFYQFMMDHILLQNGKFVLPFMMGDIYVTKAKLKLKNIGGRQLDWKTTNEVGKRTYHLNEHSKGFKYFFQWDKSRSRLKQLYLYRCQLTRDNKRRLAKLIKTGGMDYFEKQ